MLSASPTVFISYSHKDQTWLDKVRTMLAPVVRAGIASVWWDGEIKPSQAWRQEIDKALASARVGLLLVSDNFLASGFIQDNELPYLLEASQGRGVKLLWVLVSPCLYEHSPLRDIQAAHDLSRPLSTLRRRAERQEVLARIGRAVVETLASEAPDLALPPYRGSAPFEIEHADLFFGRTSLTKRLVAALRGHRFLAVLGPSGSGKSSVVRAGLIHALNNGELPGSAAWKIVLFRPGRAPLKELAVQLLPYIKSADTSKIEHIERLSNAMQGDSSALATELRLIPLPKIVFFIDQFEEIFTQTSSELERLAFCQNLLVASAPSGKASLVLTLRADFYARVIKDLPDLAERIAARQVIVRDMQESDLWEAITKPAERSGLRFEDGLVDEILKEIRGQVVALPLLQKALLYLWEQREGDTLTYAAYKAINGVKGAIAESAESAYKKLSDDQQALARLIFLELVQPGDGTEDTRLRMSQEELIAALKWEISSEIESTLEHLVQARLLTTDSDLLATEKLMEIAHESLLQEWPRLREWLATSRSSRLRHSLLQARTKTWLWYKREEESLLRGTELAEFELWGQEHGEELSPLEREYLEASLEYRKVEARKKELFEEWSSRQDSALLIRRGILQNPKPVAAIVRQAPEIFGSSEFTTSAEASAEPLPRTPDLEIAIFIDKTNALHFEIHSPDPDEGINTISLQAVPLVTSPEKILHHLFKDIENLSLDTKEAREIAEQKLAVKGLAIWKLFPRELQDLLWNWRRGAKTLLIQSDESSIPWEIAKLQGQGRDGRIISGPFLCEAYAVTRWLRGTPHQTRLPMGHMALVVPHNSKLPRAIQERREIHALAERNGRGVYDIEPRGQSVRKALAAGTYDGWHFSGHGIVLGADSGRWSIELDDSTRLSAEDLYGETANLGLARPLVFFNGGTTGRSGLTLTSPGGWSQRFLQAGARAFIGTYWAIADSKAGELAVTAYKGLFKGLPIGEAFRQARRELHRKYPGDPTWLAHTVFAHPLASCVELGPVRQPTDSKPSQLTVPVLPWRKDIDSPGALLRAQYGVVPFHGREKELADLEEWCRDPSPVKVRLYTGPGGMGKTRLALEAALKMKEEGWWTGFVTSEAIQSPEKTWKALARPKGKLLLIVDYAENNRLFLIPILREMYRLDRGTVRLILLARAALDWWEQLKNERDGIGELLSGPATTHHLLTPLVDSIDARLSSYDIATRAFSERLQVPLPIELPTNLDADYFKNATLLHMKALINLEESEEVKGEGGILDRILIRERRFWKVRAADLGIPPMIVPGIGRAMAAITLTGGVQGETEALEALRGLQFLADQPVAVLTAVARLLHECYPGERWIEPLQPDLLGEHLVQRELEKGGDELLDLALRPRSA